MTIFITMRKICEIEFFSLFCSKRIIAARSNILFRTHYINKLLILLFLSDSVQTEEIKIFNSKLNISQYFLLITYDGSIGDERNANQSNVRQHRENHRNVRLHEKRHKSPANRVRRGQSFCEQHESELQEVRTSIPASKGQVVPSAGRNQDVQRVQRVWSLRGCVLTE